MESRTSPFSDMVIITINIPKVNGGYVDMRGDALIALIKENITKGCEELKKSHPQAVWIYVWREYGITDGPNSRAVSNATKQLLKREMKNLTDTYPNCRIIAGTIAHVSEKSIEKAKEHYMLFHSKEGKQLQQMEKNEPDKQLDKHIRHFSKILEKKELKQLSVLRNTCYIFSPNKIDVIDKSIPYNEINKDDSITDDTAFRIGKKQKSFDPIVILKDMNNQDIRIGIEICREHSFGILKNFSQENYPLLHFILSDSISLHLNNLVAPFVIHVDSTYSAKLVVTKDIAAIPHPNIEILSTHLFNKHKETIFDTIPPKTLKYLLQFSIAHIIDKALQNLLSTDPRVACLQEIKTLFESSKLYEIQTIFKELTEEKPFFLRVLGEKEKLNLDAMRALFYPANDGYIVQGKNIYYLSGKHNIETIDNDPLLLELLHTIKNEYLKKPLFSNETHFIIRDKNFLKKVFLHTGRTGNPVSYFLNLEKRERNSKKILTNTLNEIRKEIVVTLQKMIKEKEDITIDPLYQSHTDFNLNILSRLEKKDEKQSQPEEIESSEIFSPSTSSPVSPSFALPQADQDHSVNNPEFTPRQKIG